MERLDALLAQADCRALLILANSGRDPFFQPFCDAENLSASFLVLPAGRSPRLGFYTPMERDEAAASGLELLDPQLLDVARWARQGVQQHEFLAHVLSRALHLCEVAPGKVALAGNYAIGKTQGACQMLASEGFGFVPGEGIVLQFRKRKTAAQLAVQRQAARGLERTYRRVAEILAGSDIASDGELWFAGERLTCGRLRLEIDRLLLEAGLDQPEGKIVALAEEAAVPHNHGTPSRVVRRGESLIVDIYPRSKLFVDCTRTFCVGEPDAELARAHATVLEAVAVARRHVTVGGQAWDVDAAVCAHFTDCGYPTYLTDPESLRGYVHGLGHGVGFDVHELPIFYRRASEAEGMLEAGDVFAMEPGLYDPEVGYGVRLEDVYALGEDGKLECLFDLPYDLDPRAWEVT